VYRGLGRGPGPGLQVSVGPQSDGDVRLHLGRRGLDPVQRGDADGRATRGLAAETAPWGTASGDPGSGA
jgi:hypothetical protein